MKFSEINGRIKSINYHNLNDYATEKIQFKSLYLLFKLHLKVNDLSLIETFPELSKMFFKSVAAATKEVTPKIASHIQLLQQKTTL